MPKDYKNINQKQSPVKNRFQGFLTFLTGLVIGLFVAFVVYLHEHQTIVENLKTMGPDITVTDTTEPQPTVEQEDNDLPEPQFDFYKILPNMEFNVSEWVASEEDTSEATSDSDSLYILQVGSFKEYKAADEIKARLALMGINADIQRVVINGRDVRHRVRVGPYKNPDKLHEARKRLRENNLDFMLLKLEIDDI